ALTRAREVVAPDPAGRSPAAVGAVLPRLPGDRAAGVEGDHAVVHLVAAAGVLVEHLDAEDLVDLGQRRRVVHQGAAHPVGRFGLVVPCRVGQQCEHGRRGGGDGADDDVVVPARDRCGGVVGHVSPSSVPSGRSTTYLSSWSSSSVMPVASSVCSGQKPRKSSKVCLPSTIASQAALSRCRISCWSGGESSGSNQSSRFSIDPSTVTFCVTTSGRTGPPRWPRSSASSPRSGPDGRRDGVWSLVPGADETKGTVRDARGGQRDGEFSPGSSAQAVQPIALPRAD